MENLKTLTLTALIALTSGCSDGRACGTRLVEGTRNESSPEHLSVCQLRVGPQTIPVDQDSTATRIDDALGDIITASGEHKDTMFACRPSHSDSLAG